MNGIGIGAALVADHTADIVAIFSALPHYPLMRYHEYVSADVGPSCDYEFAV